MATPLTADARVEARYTISGKLHKARLYCSVAAYSTGGASTINDHDGVNTHTLTQVAGVLFPLLNAVATDDANSYLFILQGRVGSVWLDNDVVPLTGGSGASQHVGWQSTFVVRMVDHTRARFVLMEGGVGVLAHTTSTAGSTGVVNALSTALTTGAVSTHNPFRWMLNRAGNPVSPIGGFVGFTNAPNRKMRRERGLA